MTSPPPRAGNPPSRILSPWNLRPLGLLATFPRGGLLLGAAILLAHLLLPRPDRRPVPAAVMMTADDLDGRSLGARPAQAEPVFHDAGTGEPVPAAAGAIFTLDDGVRRHFRGTYIGGDGWTGHLYGEPFPVDAPCLYLPVTGYPASAGNGLFVAFAAPGNPDNVLGVLRYEGANPGESVGTWEIDARGFRGAVATVEMFDDLSGMTGWLGVGRPLLGERGGRGDSGGTAGTYAISLGRHALVVAALLWLPGLALVGGWGRGRTLSLFDAARLALPGLPGLTALGLVRWAMGPGRASPWEQGYVAAVALAALAAAWRRGGPMMVNGGRVPVAPTGGERGWPGWAVLGAVAFVVFSRRPDQWARPQFWAEDAAVLFNHAWHEGFASVFRPYPGYHIAFERVAAWVASLFPATWAPGLYAAAAMTALLGTAAFIRRARLPGVGARGRAMLALALVAVPHGGEVFGTLIATYWLMAPALWVLILQGPARHRGEAVVDGAVLVGAGLTGPFIVLFAPWFLLRWRRGGWRRRYDFWLVVVAWALAAWQAGTILRTGQVTHAPLTSVPWLWVKALGFQLPGGLFFGANVPFYLGRAFFVITPALLGAAVWALARAERERAVMALTVLGGGLLAYAGGMYEYGGRRPDLFSAFGACMRYFYPFYVASAWAAVFLWHDRSPAVRRAAGVALLAMMLASASAWTAPALVPFNWDRYARRMEAGEPVVVAPINPAGWTVEIRARPR